MRERLMELIYELLHDTCRECSAQTCTDELTDHLLANGVIVPHKDIGLQKINIKKYENEFDEIAKDLFKIDEDFSGGAKVWVRTDVYKKLMKILALSNHLVKVLKILLTKEEAEKALKGGAE